jgi:hypothetical protein
MKIHKTQDYDLFQRISGNRVVSQSHVNRLLEAIQEDPETITFNPIIVNQNMEIIDGQHRFEAIKRLGLEVYYIQVGELGLHTVQKLNSVGKSWTPMDYAKSYAEIGNPNYETYIDFKLEFRFNHEVLMRYLSLDNPITGTAFKNGTFKIIDAQKSYKYCTWLKELSEYYERATLRNVALGFLQIFMSPNYDHEQGLRQMKVYGNLFTEQALSNDYARELERIYYHNLRGQKPRLF